MRYRVIRPFPGAEQGTVMDAEDFISPLRARQLEGLRYVEAIGEGDDEPAAVQTQTIEAELSGETVDLLSTSIRELRDVLPTVTSTDMLQRAYDEEPRSVAKQMYARRMEEL